MGAPHVLQHAVVERLSEFCGHGRVEVRLVALQDALQGELAHTQNLKVSLHDTFVPRSAVLVLEQPQVQDLTHPENTKMRTTQ